MTTENFEDLLDEDGNGSRELDKWLQKNIASMSIEDHSVIPHYTTGNSIDPIFELADSYFNTWTFRSHGAYEYAVEPYPHEFETPELAIAHALFKDYHLNELTEQAQEWDAYGGGGWVDKNDKNE